MIKGSFPAVFWLLFAVGFPPGARDNFFRSEFDTHTCGAVPGGAGAALPAWQGGRARAGLAEPREPLPALAATPGTVSIP